MDLTSMMADPQFKKFAMAQMMNRMGSSLAQRSGPSTQPQGGGGMGGLDSLASLMMMGRMMKPTPSTAAPAAPDVSVPVQPGMGAGAGAASMPAAGAASGILGK